MNLKWPESLPRVNWPYVRQVAKKSPLLAVQGLMLLPFMALGLLLKGGKTMIRTLGNAACTMLLVGGALAGPGLYHLFNGQNELVRTKVTGRQQADVRNPYGHFRYFIYTDQAGKLDTFSLSNGADIKEGCVYEFNLKGARLQLWPPGYTRSIKNVKTLSCP